MRHRQIDRDMPSGGGGGSGEDERLATLEQSDWLYGVNDWQLPMFQTDDDSLTFIGAENHTFALSELKLEIEPGKSRVHVTVFSNFSVLNAIVKFAFLLIPVVYFIFRTRRFLPIV